jgi:hypothetical protein
VKIAQAVRNRAVIRPSTGFCLADFAITGSIYTRRFGECCAFPGGCSTVLIFIAGGFHDGPPVENSYPSWVQAAIIITGWGRCFNDEAAENSVAHNFAANSFPSSGHAVSQILPAVMREGAFSRGPATPILTLSALEPLAVFSRRPGSPWHVAFFRDAERAML